MFSISFFDGAYLINSCISLLKDSILLCILLNSLLNSYEADLSSISVFTSSKLAFLLIKRLISFEETFSSRANSKSSIVGLFSRYLEIWSKV